MKKLVASRGKCVLLVLVLSCLFCLGVIAYKETRSSESVDADSADPLLERDAAVEDSQERALGHSRDAFVTLLYGGFLLGARVLGQSLKETGTRMDMIALCTEAVSETTKGILRADGWIIKPIGNIHNPYEGQSKRGNYFSGIFSKLYIWNMTDYERIIYVDSDALVLSNVDHMFDCGTFCATYRHSDLFNAGIIVVEPSSEIFSDMRDKIPLLPSYDDGDQGFLNVYFDDLVYAPFFNWSNSSRQRQNMRMPAELNADVGIYYISSCWNIKGDIKIIHYTLGPIKPWIWWTDRLFHLNSRWTSVRMRLPEYEGHNDKHEPFYLPIFWVPYPLLVLLYIAATRYGRSWIFSQYPGHKYVLKVLRLLNSKSTLFSHILPLPIVCLSYYLAMNMIPTAMLSCQAEYAFWLWTSFFVLLFTGTYCFLASALMDDCHAGSCLQQNKLYAVLFSVFSVNHALWWFLPLLVMPFIQRFLICLASAIVHLMVSQVIGQCVVISCRTRQQKYFPSMNLQKH